MSAEPYPSTAGRSLDSKRDPTETEFVQRIRMGDAAAFHRLFTEYFTPLRGFVLSYVKDPAVAEELVQDLFCGLWRQREQWAPQGRIRHYLLAAARNRALSYLRHQRIVDRTSQQWVAPRGSEGCPGMGGSPLGPDQLLEAAELGEACRRAIHALPERRRLVVTLRWQHQLSHAEIARILGISVKGVEAQLSRALKSLRHLLADFLPEAVNRQQ